MYPHGEAEVRTVWMRELASVLGNRYIYSCPHLSQGAWHLPSQRLLEGLTARQTPAFRRGRRHLPSRFVDETD